MCEFTFISLDEHFDIEWLKKRPEQQASLIEELSCSVSERLVREFISRDKRDSRYTSKYIQYLMDDLTEVGVVLDAIQLEQLMNLLVNLHNHSRLWSLCGWKPSELANCHILDQNQITSIKTGLNDASKDESIAE